MVTSWLASSHRDPHNGRTRFKGSGHLLCWLGGSGCGGLDCLGGARHWWEDHVSDLRGVTPGGRGTDGLPAVLVQPAGSADVLQRRRVSHSVLDTHPAGETAKQVAESITSTLRVPVCEVCGERTENQLAGIFIGYLTTDPSKAAHSFNFRIPRLGRVRAA